MNGVLKTSEKREKTFLPLFVSLAFLSLAAAEPRTYRIDFGVEASPVADGFEPIDLASLQETQDPTFSVVDQSGKNPIELRFRGSLGGYSLGNLESPLTTDGVYTFLDPAEAQVADGVIREPKTVEFEIAALPEGSTVTLYGICGWDGSGRAGFLSLGDSGMIDLGPSLEPTSGSESTDGFVLVAADQKIDASGVIRGVFSESDGAQTKAEAQLGGLILVVDVP